jgi:RNA polymerase sigma-70 factor (ECF subfamily)
MKSGNIHQIIQMNNSEQNSDLIIERAIKGDDEAFSMLYQENLKKIYNYIYYRTGNSHDAEDLTARVFQRALNHISKYKKTAVPFSAWLYRIAHNLVANWHRDNNRRKEVPLEEQTETRNKQEIPEREIEDRQDVEFLLKAMHRLSHDRQMVIILKYVEDLSNIEIGKIMRKSEGAIKSLYHRTLLELRSYLEVSGEDEK